MSRRGWLVAAACLVAVGCAETGVLGPPAGYRRPSPTPCPTHSEALALACFAPVVMQELQPPAERYDRPTPLDPDGSGELRDDAFELPERLSPALPVPFYATLVADEARLYLFYGLYYPVDWSGDPVRPSFDHLGDVEGALVVASRGEGLVEAVVTQAHNLFYVFTPSVERPSAGSSGTVPLTPTGRPILFSESGGHGVYAFGAGRWEPAGGSVYPNGPAGVPADRLLRIDPEAAAGTLAVEIRPLEQLRRFTDSEGRFLELPRGAKPPWHWADKRGGVPGEPGLIVTAPARLYDALLRGPRP